MQKQLFSVLSLLIIAFSSQVYGQTRSSGNLTYTASGTPTDAETSCRTLGYFDGTNTFQCCVKNISVMTRTTSRTEGTVYTINGKPFNSAEEAMAAVCGAPEPEPTVPNTGACYRMFPDDSSANYYCCVDRVNAGQGLGGCISEPTPVEPSTPPTTGTPPLPTTPTTPPPVVGPIVDTSTLPGTQPTTQPSTQPTVASFENATLTCGAADSRDVVGGKIMALRADGLVPLVIRYQNEEQGPAVQVDLKQISGLTVRTEDKVDADFGQAILTSKSLASVASTTGSMEWTVYLPRPTKLLMGEWKPDGVFEVDIRDETGALVSQLQTSCVAEIQAQGGCALNQSAGSTPSVITFMMLFLTPLWLVRRMSLLEKNKK